MSGHPRRTITKAEIKALQKDLRAGVPKHVIARALNLREDCVLNFVDREVALRVRAQEIILQREEAKLQERAKEVEAETTRLLEEEEEELKVNQSDDKVKEKKGFK